MSRFLRFWGESEQPVTVAQCDTQKRGNEEYTSCQNLSEATSNATLHGLWPAYASHCRSADGLGKGHNYARLHENQLNFLLLPDDEVIRCRSGLHYILAPKGFISNDLSD